jgi:hypothetical protein
MFINADSKNIQEDLGSGILTYDEAVELAVKESTRIKNVNLQKESASIKLDDRFDDFGDSLKSPEILAIMELQKREKMNSDGARRTENLILNSLKYSIKTSFNDISVLKDEIELKEKQLQNDIKKRNILNLKNEYGMESKTNIISKDIEINQLKLDIDKSKKTLDEKYVNLNRILGFDSFERYDIEQLDFSYIPIKDNQDDVDFKAKRTVSSDVSVWAKEQELDIQSLRVDNYALHFIDGLKSNQQIAAPSAPYKALALDVTVSSNELEQAKTDVKNAVIDKYNKIKMLENTYDTTKLKLNELEEKKRILEVALKAGTAIQQDYDDLMLAIEQIENILRTIESSHSLLVEIYNNPVLAGASIN